MKSLVAILFAGAMVSAVFAAGNDNGADARFRMKYGRPSPQATAASQTARKTVASEPLAAFSDAEERFKAKYGRPSPQQKAVLQAAQKAAGLEKVQAAALPASNDADERFKMKSGRPSPQEEIRLAAARKPAEPVLMASNECSMHDCCKRSH